MGCDIHAHLELKVDGVWHHYNKCNIPRNYRLFGRLAGIRDGSVEPIAAPRGVPDDASVITKLESDHDGDDGHTHSWITDKELLVITEEFDWFYGHDDCFVCQALGYMQRNHPTDHLKYPGEITLPGESLRMVFWFDN